MNDSGYNHEKGEPEDVKKAFSNKHSYTSDLVEKEKLYQELRKFIKNMTVKKKNRVVIEPKYYESV